MLLLMCKSYAKYIVKKEKSTKYYAKTNYIVCLWLLCWWDV